ncbi:MAG: RlmF-related methyltransferase [Desulfobacterales bacterium]|nr:RlmF-related methyltransferase [Desulfobacterales bacterium]
MTAENNNKEKNRSQLHPRNPHVGRYDLVSLCKSCPELTSYLRLNPDGEFTIDFSDQKAVIFLNKALLAKFYNVKNWQIP